MKRTIDWEITTIQAATGVITIIFFADCAHDLVGTGENADADGKAADQKQKLSAAEVQIFEGDALQRIGVNKNAHDIADVV